MFLLGMTLCSARPIRNALAKNLIGLAEGDAVSHGFFIGLNGGVLVSAKNFTLAQLPVGGVARVASILSNGPERRRMLDLGLIEGTRVQTLLRSPSGNPVAYLIRGAVIALREEDSSGIMVTQRDSDLMQEGF